VRIFYRASQFWNALHARPASQDITQTSQALTTEMMALFLSMQPSEQSHSLAIYHQLLDQGETDQDLLMAALLHDVGKICYPLRSWERATIVLGKALLPIQARRWGQSQPKGWRRPFVVAEQHPTWGAKMAAKAGASPIAVSLIRRHQDKMIPQPEPKQSLGCEELLLHKLQLLDNES
jgi:hypothetical protein